MSLEEELRRLRIEGQPDEKLQIAHQDLLARLARAETGKRALKLGDAMPSFILPDAEGRLVASDELLARGALVVTFICGNWCPYSLAALRALEAFLPRIEAEGARLVALTPDTGRHLADTKQALHLTYEILSDVDGTVGLQFGVLFRVPVPFRELLAGSGVELAERHGNDGGFLPLPATFVVDPGGIVQYAFVEIDLTRRAEPSAILAVLAAMRSTSS
jgi:peroxiredoxin